MTASETGRGKIFQKQYCTYDKYINYHLAATVDDIITDWGFYINLFSLNLISHNPNFFMPAKLF